MDDNRRSLVRRIRSAIADRKSARAVMQTAVELIDTFSDGYNWTGVYMMRDNVLEVGPYVGPETPHTRIELGQGICGAAASQRQSIIVNNVAADARFLACSKSTRSEIVVPLMDGHRCLGEIDIDSDRPDFFTREDQEMLEAVAGVIVRRLKALPGGSGGNIAD